MFDGTEHTEISDDKENIVTYFDYAEHGGILDDEEHGYIFDDTKNIITKFDDIAGTDMFED